MFVVAGVSGNTGKVVANTLLAQGLPVRVIVRDAAKGASWRERGAEVAVADVHDAAAMTQALRGAHGAYLLNPPNMAITDITGNATQVFRAAKTAIADSGVAHVVVLSSVGAHLSSGTGPVVAAYLGEQMLGELRTPLTFLRAGYFMENLLANITPMTQQGVLPAMFDPHAPVEMVATADIGAVAAGLLRAGTSSAGVVELAGPAPRTLTEVAAVFGAALNKTIAVAPVPAAAQFDVLRSVGLNDAWARAYAELNAAVVSTIRHQSPPQRGLITLERFAAQSLRA